MPSTQTQTPPVGLYPFWFWNDNLDADEIRRQVSEMHAKGVKGFFIHPRQGLQQPYMSSSFLGLVRVAIEEARRLGMIVHLYDEYPYPSGVAGGEVILGRPAFQATHLQQRIFDVKGGRIRLELIRGYTLQCIAFPCTPDGAVNWRCPRDLRADVGMVLRAESFMKGGLTVYNRKRYFASEPTPTLDTQLPTGQWRIFLSTQTLVEGHKYWYNFVDVLNPEAIREFLRLTHERYFQRFGEDFGGLVQSIFVDETAPHWSALIPAEFAKECGYDLTERLCALQDESHPQHLRTTADLQRVRHRMFCESFDGQIRDWCHAHGLKYSGEKTQQRFSQFDYMDIPGCEPGHTKAGNPDLDYLRAGLRQNARAATSAAYFHGKEGALCECFHSLGWSGTLQDARLIAEGLLLMGIRYLVPHGFFYSTHGLKKHDAPPTFFHQMPYWPLFGHMTARLDRIAKSFEDTWIDAQILVLDPSAALPTKDQSMAYERLLWNLAGAHLDFHIGDLDVLNSGQMESDRLRVGDLEIWTVVLPPARNWEPEILAWLDAFEQQGGTVVRTTDDPDQALGDTAARVQPSLPMHALAGDARRVLSVCRRDQNNRCWFLLNTAAESATLEFPSDLTLRELPLSDASPPLLEQSADGWRRVLAPFESILLEETQTPDTHTPPPIVPMEFGGACTVRPLSPNLLRLNTWRMDLLDEKGDTLESAEVEALPLANQLRAAGFRFAPQFVGGGVNQPQLRLPALRVRYVAEFAVESGVGTAVLLMEPGSIKGDWSVQINDGRLLHEKDFKASAAHVSGSREIDIAALLAPGTNRITVNVSACELDHGLRNPLYVAGDFAVQFQPLRLTRRDAAGTFEAYEANGLPFFSGSVEYAFTTNLTTPLPTGDILLEPTFANPCEEAIELSFNRGQWHAAPWSPRRILVPTTELCQGANQVRVRVHTSLIRAFEGQCFNVQEHRYEDVGSTLGD